VQKTPQTNVPESIRVSLGTAIVTGLTQGKIDAQPTTAYLMTYHIGKCTANCGFCPQARTSKSNADLLSRVSWPIFPTSTIISALKDSVEKKKIDRVCIQALNYPEVIKHIQALVKEIKKRCGTQVSISCQPKTKENIKTLAIAGADRIGIALDAATPELFDKIKGAGSHYKWKNEFTLLKTALSVFGKGNVSTHVIVGLGETEKQAATIIQRCIDMGVLPALFAFTPIRGTALQDQKQPPIGSYRRVQLARYLIVYNKKRVEKMQFSSEGKITDFGLEVNELNTLIEGGEPFRTTGCPNCNRPFYNEKPSGPIYNYPKQPNMKEIEKIKKELT
jgi:lipoyl synthase